MSLDIEFESFQALDGDSVCSSDKNHEIFLLFFVKRVQKLPKISK